MSALLTTDTTPGRSAFQRDRQTRQPRRNREVRHGRPTAERLDGYAQMLTNHRRRLALVSMVYRDQASVYPLQVEDTVRYLIELRRLVGIAHTYLGQLEPAEMKRIQPNGCVTKLATVDYLITELLLNAAMFARVCNTICPERVQTHMTIRAAFSALLTCYDDLLSQLGALSDKACERATEPGKSGEKHKEEHP